MKLQFLGTGAADWNIDSRRDGDFFRRFSSAVIDGTLLIDPGPHIYDFAEKNGTPDMFLGVTDIIVTHSHADHFNPGTVKRIAAGTDHSVRLWASPVLFKAFAGETCALPQFMPLEVGKVVDAGGYFVTPCRSNHGPFKVGEDTFNFIVKKDGRSLFYGADSGWIMYDTYLAIKDVRPNAWVFECTVGNVVGDDRCFGHTSIKMIEVMMSTIIPQRAAADDCKFYATHMARGLHGTHEQTVADLAHTGVVPAYDGMTVEI